MRPAVLIPIALENAVGTPGGNQKPWIRIIEGIVTEGGVCAFGYEVVVAFFHLRGWRSRSDADARGRGLRLRLEIETSRRA